MSGFAYSDSVNENSKYSKAAYFEYSLFKNIAIIKNLNIKGLYANSEKIELEELDDNIYIKKISNNATLILDNSSPNIILSYITNDITYTFTKNPARLLKSVNKQLEERNSFCGLEKNEDSKIIIPFAKSKKGYPAGTVKVKNGKSIYMKAIWNPQRKNKLYIRVNTNGRKIATTVYRLKISNGKVPSRYDIISLNPSGSNPGNNFQHVVDYILNQICKIYLPSYTTSISSYNGSRFSFDLTSMKNVKWNSMNSKKSNAKGWLFRLYLDNNTKKQKPAPTGKIIIYYYISATGAFKDSMSF